ncbi:MAG: alpha/beta hydrolase [Bryobacterales bacterium]|nr:alpha/beta hydrolase [Bryobacterales bacterium]MBV9399896.1 alpha/beta hydrolase [Bryobacterales bacterium]
MKIALRVAACILVAPVVLFFGARGAILLATKVLEHRYPPPGQMVDVAADRRLHLYCTGSGSPTIVLETGIGTDWISWRPLSSALAESHKVCVYDRAGYAWSDPGPMPRTALATATDLHAMLANAPVAGPYLLVAHSFGGYIARMYASRYEDSLSGIVMVDPLQEEDGHAPNPGPRGLLALLPPIGLDRLKRLYKGAAALPPDLKDAPEPYQDRFIFASSMVQLKSERNEFDSLPLSEQELAGVQFPADVPLTVITAGHDPEHWRRQERLVHMSRLGAHVRAADSGHSVQQFQPDIIMNAVEEMLKKTGS